MKKTCLAVAGLLLAALAAAQLAKYKDWPKSPEAFFLTPEERAEWARIASDADAEKFIAAYWAKRRPGFREEVERRIAAADEQFKMLRQKGSESVRGRIYITLGSPNRRIQSRAAGAGPDTGADSGMGTGRGDLTGESAFSAGLAQMVETWVYNKDRFDSSWGFGELRAQITVDPQRGLDRLQNVDEVNRVLTKVVEGTIVNPAAPEKAPAPSASQPAVPSVVGTGAGSGAPAPPPPASPAASLPAATRTSLEALLKETKASPGFWGGSFRAPTGGGESFYALEFYFAGAEAPSGPVKFGGVVAAESGGEVASYWEDATLSEMKTGSRADKAYVRSIVLSPGSYRGSFGIFSADGAPLESASASFKLEPKGSDFEVSPLILTNELKPQTKVPGPTDPFVFGVEKPIQVEPKADRTFSKQDSLWYFYTVLNPKLPESAPASPGAPAPSVTPDAAPAEAAPKPRVMQRIGVLRDGKAAFAPFTGPAETQPLSTGSYGSGSEIPLATFEPGYYTLTLNVRDLNAPRESAAFKGIDRQADFVVLKPDGTLPDKAAAKPAPAPTAKPRPKKS